MLSISWKNKILQYRYTELFMMPYFETVSFLATCQSYAICKVNVNSWPRFLKMVECPCMCYTRLCALCVCGSSIICLLLLFISLPRLGYKNTSSDSLNVSREPSIWAWIVSMEYNQHRTDIIIYCSITSKQ